MPGLVIVPEHSGAHHKPSNSAAGFPTDGDGQKLPLIEIEDETGAIVVDVPSDNGMNVVDTATGDIPVHGQRP